MDGSTRPWWARWVPASQLKAMGLTAGISVAVGIALILLVTHVFKSYGLTLFLATPCALGILAPLLYGLGAPRTFVEFLGIAILAQVALFAGVLVFAIEGIICILMASPIWMTLAVVGACIAYPIHWVMWRRYRFGNGFPVGMLLLLMLIPALAGAERAGETDAPLWELTSSIDIDASPSVVWAHLVEFPDMPGPRAWPFRVGIAYPIRAELKGRGVGATRYCVFSTGKAEEPVRVWEEGKLLDIDVISTPPPMVEWSPYPGIHPPHLDGYLVSERARFELIPLANGRTRLVGTSWYRNRIFPAAYWRLWSDAIIREVHRAVMTSVKERSEAAAGANSNN
jgi:hypothetical protein